MLFGEYVRSRGFTLRQLADATGISIRTLEAYSSGARNLKICRADWFLALAKALRVSPYKLLKLID